MHLNTGSKGPVPDAGFGRRSSIVNAVGSHSGSGLGGGVKLVLSLFVTVPDLTMSTSSAYASSSAVSVDVRNLVPNVKVASDATARLPLRRLPCLSPRWRAC